MSSNVLRRKEVLLASKNSLSSEGYELSDVIIVDDTHLEVVWSKMISRNDGYRDCVPITRSKTFHVDEHVTLWQNE